MIYNPPTYQGLENICFFFYLLPHGFFCELWRNPLVCSLVSGLRDKQARGENVIQTRLLHGKSNSVWQSVSFMIGLQELFKEIDQEKDGEIYLKEVVLYLKALNQNLDTLEVLLCGN